jgi:tetratricopeptide (TPR) repeat protein
MEMYSAAINNYRIIGDTTGLLDVNINLAIIYRKTARHDDAIKLLQQNLNYYKKIYDTLEIIIGYQGLANVYYVLGSFESAISYYDSAFALNQNAKDLEINLDLLINIGAVYETQNHFEGALSSYFEALNLVKSLNYPAKKAIILKNIGAVYLQTGENMKALDALFESLYLRDSLGLEGAKARTMLLIGKAYEFEGNLQRANEMYIQSLNILHDYGDLRQVAHALTYIGKNLQLQENFTSALAYYRQSINVAKDADLVLELAENFKHLVILFAEQKMEDSTFKYIDLYANAKQKLNVELDVTNGENTFGEQIIHKINNNSNHPENENSDSLLRLNWAFTVVFVSGLVAMIFLLISFLMLQKRKLNKRKL